MLSACCLCQSLTVSKPTLSFNKLSCVHSCSFVCSTACRCGKLLSFSDLDWMISAFISSQLDQCMSLYAGVHQADLSWLLLVQNAAASLNLNKTSRNISNRFLSSRPIMSWMNRLLQSCLTSCSHVCPPDLILDLILDFRSDIRSDDCFLAILRSMLVHRGQVTWSSLWTSLDLRTSGPPEVGRWELRSLVVLRFRLFLCIIQASTQSFHHILKQICSHWCLVQLESSLFSSI